MYKFKGIIFLQQIPLDNRMATFTNMRLVSITTRLTFTLITLGQNKSSSMENKHLTSQVSSRELRPDDEAETDALIVRSTLVK